MHELISTQPEYSRVTFCWCLTSLSLCAAFSSLVLCLANLSCFSLHGLTDLSSKLRKTTGVPLVSPAWNSLKAVGHSNQRTYLDCFSSLRHHSPLLPDKQCLKNCYFIYFGHFLVISGRTINPVSVIPSFPKQKSFAQFVVIINSIHQFHFPQSYPCHTTFF